MAHETGSHVRNNLQTEGICLNTNTGEEMKTKLSIKNLTAETLGMSPLYVASVPLKFSIFISCFRSNS
jgi:hypothetical protein